MKILIVHNYYQHAGGEDAVFKTECAMLTKAGHEVVTWETHNDAIDTSTPAKALRTAVKTVWNRDSYHALRAVIHTHRPDVVHFHNTFPLISPAAYWACKKENTPVVQTLHNFRLGCLNALLFRRGRVCEKCLGKMPWRGVRHQCYRQSLGASLTI
ncbi:MAG: glycosyltransferase, partial [Kiritimatiellaeota bacterium]|nr:glycosyltransferase [Kiritimatiellota bacterium]